CAVSFILGIVIAVDPTSSIVQGIDDRWLQWMVSSRTPFWTRVAKDVSAIGSLTVTLPLRVCVSAVLAWHRRWLQLGAFVGAVITSELCIGPVKALVDRPRPPNPLISTSASPFLSAPR